MRNLYIPTTVVDGFLDNPDAFRKFALEQDYHSDNLGRFPGARTAHLSTLSPIVFDQVCEKILALFFTNEQAYSYTIESSFQLVNKNYNTGWVHKDPMIITAMLYLTPGSYSGTSLYLKKNISYNNSNYVKDKIVSYKLESDNIEACNLHNQNYEEVMNVKGLYNRLFVFDSNMYHAAHDFFGSSMEESRLTLVSFVHKLTCDYCGPLQRSRSVGGQTTL